MSVKLVLHLDFPVKNAAEAKYREGLLLRKFARKNIIKTEVKDGFLTARLEYPAADLKSSKQKLGEIIARNGLSTIRQVVFTGTPIRDLYEPYTIMPNGVHVPILIDMAFLKAYRPERRHPTRIPYLQR